MTGFKGDQTRKMELAKTVEDIISSMGERERKLEFSPAGLKRASSLLCKPKIGRVDP